MSKRLRIQKNNVLWRKEKRESLNSRIRKNWRYNYGI